MLRADDADIAEKDRRIREVVDEVASRVGPLPWQRPPQADVPSNTCEFCAARFARKKHLVQHQQNRSCFWRDRAGKAEERKVAVRRSTPSSVTPTSDTGERFDCPRCRALFRSRRALLKHIKRRSCHWRQRRDKQTAKRRAAKLAAAARSSGAPKPYACGVCPKRYESRKALKKHRRHAVCAPQAPVASKEALLAVEETMATARVQQPLRAAPTHRTVADAPPVDLQAQKLLASLKASGVCNKRMSFFVVDASVAVTPPTTPRGDKPHRISLELIDDDAPVLEGELLHDGKSAAPPQTAHDAAHHVPMNAETTTAATSLL